MRVNYAHVASFQAVKSLFAKLQFLTLRDVKLRYKQTALGVAWAAIQPLFTMAVFTVFFGNLGKLPSDGKPYAQFVLASPVPWLLFA